MWIVCPFCTLPGLVAFVLRDVWRELLAFVVAVVIVVVIFWPRSF